MSKAKCDGRQEDNRAFQDDEGCLILNEALAISVLQFRHTVAATGQDEQRRGCQAGEEGSEAPAPCRGAARPEVADHVVCKGGDEGGQDDDLEAETCLGHIDTDLVGARGVCRHGTACSLKSEADNIKGDEDVVKQLRLEAREVRAEKHDGLGQGHVDGSRVKDGGNSEGDWTRRFTS